MTDVDEIVDVTSEVAEEEKPEWKPSWDLPKEEDKPLTKADIAAMIAEATQTKSIDDPDVWEDVIAKAEERILNKVAPMLDATQAAVTRPMLVSELCSGLGEKAKTAIKEALSKYNSAGLSGIANDPTTLKILRAYAEKEDGVKEKKEVPKSSETGVPKNNLSGSLLKEAEESWERLKHMPGANKEEHMKFYQETYGE